MKNRRKMQPNEVFIDENVKMDDLQFYLGDEWSSMMLNDLDTSKFGEENELSDESPSFYQQTSFAQFLQAFFHNHDTSCEILGNQ